MLLDFVKKVFKIEYIFIYIAVIIIFCTAYFKRVSNSLMRRLDSDMFLIQLSASSESKDAANEAQDIAGRLSEDYEPFTHFDEALRESLDAIIQNIQNGSPMKNAFFLGPQNRPPSETSGSIRTNGSSGQAARTMSARKR